jgi:methionyl-tRNA formyltransferase
MDRPLGEQFDLLRISDPMRYPAFFDWMGHRYVLRIEKVLPEATKGDGT